MRQKCRSDERIAPYHADYSTDPEGLAQGVGLEPKNHGEDDSTEVSKTAHNTALKTGKRKSIFAISSRKISHHHSIGVYRVVSTSDNR